MSDFILYGPGLAIYSSAHEPGNNKPENKYPMDGSWALQDGCLDLEVSHSSLFMGLTKDKAVVLEVLVKTQLNWSHKLKLFFFFVFLNQGHQRKKSFCIFYVKSIFFSFV